jgi:ABC-type molybdate transport system substrate-binding protein
MRVHRKIAAALLLVAAGASGPGRAEEPLRIFAAGSLTQAFTDEITAFGAPAGAIATPVFGPSGVLRERIEKGDPADLFASADMASPTRLAADRGHLTVTPFARNRLCVQGQGRLGLAPENLLDRMLDPGLVLATSTPRADPGGDYAWAVFARADEVRPGARAALEAKAKPLVGGPTTALALPGHGAVAGLFLTGKADLFLGYCSNVDALLAEVPGLVSVPLSRPLAPAGADRPTYGMVVITGNAMARRFADFVLSPAGQSILVKYGFEPVSAP